MLIDFVPFIIMVLIAIGLSLSLLAASKLLGPHRPNRIKLAPYESGMDPVGSARERYSVRFYLVAMIFIVFDVEVVFMYPWAVSFREFLDDGIGFGVLGVIVFFIIVLAIGLIYDIKKGGLEFS
ncbi:MAG TPA: NADH-quinone oxidoreductase subunit A [Rhodothermales bacterium]|nr:NADH-quinone oxidoreductase subunit A [Rhodothermales bacterium]